ncbi:FAD/NAD(P)-binding protein [Furfurilactobacillus entadae]|uniref:FAD/NAD(P)-binding protein n=1 Tax=Furfurilactobacillus entadae TaxID=2922307 RepID=UPI0035EF42A7
MDITVIGAGPRGLITAERLIEWQRKTSQNPLLTITMVDPFGIGGRVWPVDQPHELLMNTNPDFITLFTDETVKMAGPVAPGPNLFEWAHHEAPAFLFSHPVANRAALLAEAAALVHNGYASRSLFGAYQQWFFLTLQDHLPDNVTLTLRTETVNSLRHLEQTDRYLIKTTTSHFQADAVIMALGHSENDLTPEQTGLLNFADEHNLQYTPPTQPQEYRFDDLAAGETIILRGLGLNFFDATTMLTQGRGGYFTSEDDHLVYHPSGIEPHIIAGSRRGYPLRAKGHNQKAARELDSPHFFTPTWFAQYQAVGSLTGTKFMEQFHHEAEYVYYKRLLALKYPQVDAGEFLHAFETSPQPEGVVYRSPIIESDYLNWTQLLNPTATPASTTPQPLLDYLQADVKAALAGTKTGPLTSALELFRDLRDVVRRIVDGQLLRTEDFRNVFLGQFNNENSYLSVGPPEQRIAELRALMVAGIVTVVGPNMRVDSDTTTNQFVTWSPLAPTERYFTDHLVEARLPAVSASHSCDPLTQSLLRSGLARPQQLAMEDGSTFQTGAVDVDMVTNQLVTTTGQSATGLYFLGVPTEGRHWFTTASPRPGVNDSVLRTVDATVAHLFTHTPEAD